VRYSVGCKLEYQVPGPSVFVFNLAPAETASQAVEYEHLSVTPELPVEEFAAPGTYNRYHRVEALGGRLMVDYYATVTTEPRIDDPDTVEAARPVALPLSTLPYLWPSRYCQSDQLMRLAYREFGALPHNFERPARIAEWIHANVDYLVGTTGPLTSAFDTATARAGVCRDFAHLGIAFCRSINIPARFVSGYAFDLWPRDFHAVFEAWLGGRWYLFDPTRQASPGGLVRIGTGRDAADVSFALIFGPAVLTRMEVHADPMDEPSDRLPKQWIGRAVSTA